MWGLALIGTYLIIDGVCSWLEYRKQQLIMTKNKTLISMHWFHSLLNPKIEGKMFEVEQSIFEHVPRFARIYCGIFLLGVGTMV